MGIEGDGNMMTRQYHRVSVFQEIDEFCGWEALKELLKYAQPTLQDYIVFGFKTGGRAKEVLALKTDNFKIDKRRKAVLINGMKLEKRYRKIQNQDGTTSFQTIVAQRRPFGFPLKEQLSKEIVEILIANPDGLLFPSSYKFNMPLTQSWAYKGLVKLSKNIPNQLRQDLGLNRPLLDRITGQSVRDSLHLWTHWLRSQRACQLRADYNFVEGDLLEWFSWRNFATATHYSRIGTSRLLEKMH